MQDWTRNLGWMLFGVALTVTTDGFGLFQRAGTTPSGSERPPADRHNDEKPVQKGLVNASHTAPTPPTAAPDPATPAVNAETLAQLQAQLTALEQLLAARKNAPPGATPTDQGTTPRSGSSRLDGDLAELMARQNGITQGTQSDREREIDADVEERALKAVGDIRKLISARESQRQQQFEQIIKDAQ